MPRKRNDAGALTTAKRVLWANNPHKCVYCDCKLKFKTATVDHFVPTNAGGKNDIENYVLACDWCNNKKGGDSFATIEEAREHLKKLRKGK